MHRDPIVVPPSLSTADSELARVTGTLAGVSGAVFMLNLSAVTSRDGELQNFDRVAPQRLVCGLYQSYIYDYVFYRVH